MYGVRGGGAADGGGSIRQNEENMPSEGGVFKGLLYIPSEGYALA